MRYQLTPISTRPWLLNGLSLRLIESHYEKHYGGALRRLNAITEQIESLDFDHTPGYVVNSLKRNNSSRSTRPFSTSCTSPAWRSATEGRLTCSPKHSPATSDQ